MLNWLTVCLLTSFILFLCLFVCFLLILLQFLVAVHISHFMLATQCGKMMYNTRDLTTRPHNNVVIHGQTIPFEHPVTYYNCISITGVILTMYLLCLLVPYGIQMFYFPSYKTECPLYCCLNSFHCLVRRAFETDFVCLFSLSPSCTLNTYIHLELAWMITLFI